MKSLVIKGNKRQPNGKKGAKNLRSNDLVLCSLYGGKQNVEFSVPVLDLKKLVYTPEVYTVDLDIEGSKFPAIMKEIQFHPVTDRILHIDFVELSNDKPVILDIPVKILGNAAGVRAGGRLLTKVRKLQVKALPKDLPDTIDVNVESLEIGQSVRVGDIKIKGVELLDSPNNVITAVKTTRQVAPEAPLPGAPAPAAAAAAPATAPAK